MQALSILGALVLVALIIIGAASTAKRIIKLHKNEKDRNDA